jgi:hypothetical protein
VEILGMLARERGIANHRVLVHFQQAAGLAHPAALGEMRQQVDDLRLRQSGAKQRRAFPFGKPCLTRLAPQQPVFLLATVAAADGQIVEAALAEAGTFRILAAEACEVVHDPPSVAE